MDESIQATIRKYGLQAGISQSQMANQLGLHSTHISKVENLRSGVTLEVLEKYLKAAGCKLVVVPDTFEASAVAVRLEALSERQRRVVLLLVASMPNLPDVLLDEVERQAESWAARFGDAPG